MGYVGVMRDHRVKVGLSDQLLAAIDAERGLIPRERWIRAVLTKEVSTEHQAPVKPRAQRAPSAPAPVKDIVADVVSEAVAKPPAHDPTVVRPGYAEAEADCAHWRKEGRPGARVCLSCGKGFA